MKRLLVLVSVAVLGAAGTAFGQAGVNESSLLQKVDKAEAATKDPKKSGKAATWIALGEANYEATTAPTSKLFKGMDEPTMNLVLGRRDLTSETVNDMELGKASYDYLDVYLKDGIVVFWKEKKTINDGGLEKSLAAYLKAYDLDKGNASTLKKVQEGVTTLYNAYKQVGDNNYTQRSMPAAAAAFGKAYDLTKGGIIDVQDTTSGFNAGLIYAIIGDYADGEKYLSAALDDGLYKGGDTYYYLNICQAGEGKNAEAKETLMEGIKAFPMNTKLVEGLLSVYAATGEDPNTIIPIVEEAIQKDPKNPELYAGLGRVYDKLGQADKSIEAFNHALSLAPEDFGTNFNIGLMLIKQGDAANNILKDKPFTSKKAFDEDLAKVNNMYSKARKGTFAESEGCQHGRIAEEPLFPPARRKPHKYGQLQEIQRIAAVDAVTGRDIFSKRALFGALFFILDKILQESG